MEETIRQATCALAAALSRGDASGAAALYADDGRLLTPAADLIAGRREIETYWRAGISFGLIAAELAAQELELGCGVAVEIGRYALTLAVDGGEPFADRGKYVVLHRRRPDGTWCRAVDVFNPDVPEAARPNAKEER